MANVILVANWKEYGTLEETKMWAKAISHEKQALEERTIIVCPPFTALSTMNALKREYELPISVGAQDVSRYEEGKHTGEISAKMLAELTSYVIIGHSETRRNCKLTDEDVAKKVQAASSANITPIVCVEEISQAHALKKMLPEFTGIIAYEPPTAIGTGNPASPNQANTVAKQIKEIFPTVSVLYGGSVDGNNASGFLQEEIVTGFLIGNRSLDPNFFLEIVKNAHKDEA